MSDKNKIDVYLNIVTSRVIPQEFPQVYDALRAVLYRLPESVLQVITRDKPVFFYVLPAVIGMHTCYIKESHEDIDLSKGFCPIIFRSELNSFDDETITAIVVHEIAHAYLHSNLDSKPEVEKEAEVLKIVKEWGFLEDPFNNKILNLEKIWESPEKYW